MLIDPFVETRDLGLDRLIDAYEASRARGRLEERIVAYNALQAALVKFRVAYEKGGWIYAVDGIGELSRTATASNQRMRPDDLRRTPALARVRCEPRSHDNRSGAGRGKRVYRTRSR